MPKKREKIGASAPRTRRAGSSKKRKLAVVMSGGGMRCAYGAGALLAIAEQYKVIEPDILIAASGSAGNSAYYLSEQWNLAATIWMHGTTNPKFISFRRWHILDVDYLIDEVFKKQHPLDIEKIKNKKTTWLLPVTRVRDGATVYLSPQRTEKVYEYLRAAKATPIAYGKKISIDGVEYVDGDFGADTEDLARKALSLGATDVVAIESNPVEFVRNRKRVAMNVARAIEKLEKEPGIARAIERELAATSPIRAPKGGAVLRIAPSKNLRVSVAEKSKLKIRTAFNLGYADARDSTGLREMLTRTS